MKPRRTKRVSELIKREIADLIQKGIKGKTFGITTVTDVEVSNDLSVAKVFVSVYGESQENSPILDELRKKTSLFRKRLAGRITLRQFPEIQFMWDNSFERGERISHLLDKITDDSTNNRHSQE